MERHLYSWIERLTILKYPCFKKCLIKNNLYEDVNVIFFAKIDKTSLKFI